MGCSSPNIEEDSKGKEDKTIKNRFLKRKIKKSLLKEDEQDLLNSLPNKKISYYCSWCYKIPFLPTFQKVCQYSRYDMYAIISDHNNISSSNKCSKQMCYSRGLCDPADLIIDDKNSITFKMKDDLIKKYKDNKSENLLPFETKEDLDKFLNVLNKFNNLKQEIAEYNFGDFRSNFVFHFFENLLIAALYGFGTLYEYMNALAISDFLTFNDISYANNIEKLKNGNKLYMDKVYCFYRIKGIFKLNNQNLYAFQLKNFHNYNEAFYLDILDLTKEDFIDQKNFNDIITKYISQDALKEKKNYILYYSDSRYKNIVELKKDKYLLHEEYNGLVLASYKKNWNFKETDIRAQSIIKLKSGKIFIYSWETIILSEYDKYRNKLVILKSKIISVKRSSEKNPPRFLCYELNNGKVVFTLLSTKFCIVDIKTFCIQTVFDIKVERIYAEILLRFKQIKEYLLYAIGDNFFKINIKTGKTEKISAEKYELYFYPYASLGNYLIKSKGDKYEIFDRLDNNNSIYKGYYFDTGIEKIIVVTDNEKEKIFALIGIYYFYGESYTPKLKIKFIKMIESSEKK